MQPLDERLNSVLKMEGRLDSKINGVSETMYHEEEEGDCFEYEGLQWWLQGKVDMEDEKENNGNVNKVNRSDVVSELSAETEDCSSNGQRQKGRVAAMAISPRHEE